ncbi:hypothetical protein Tco_0585279 [Tanacetum coccineum]
MSVKADETVIKEWEDKMERAATAASSLEAEQDNAKTVNGERQIQALVDKKKVIITETSIRHDLKLDDAEGTDCLPTATIFAELERMGAKTTAWNEFSSTMASAILQKTWVKIQLLLLISIPHPFITQPSSSKPQKKKPRRKQRKDSGPTKLLTGEATNEEHVSTPSYDPPQSAKTDQAKEIASLKKRVKQLEKRRKSRTLGLKRLKKEDASKQRRKIADLDADAEVTLIDETQGRKDEDLMFDTGVLDVTTAGDNVEIPDELTLAQTLIEIKSTKPKAITTAATTVTPISTNQRQKEFKEKGKGKMVEPEPEKKTGRKTQIQLDEELAFKMHAEEQEEASRAAIIEELDSIHAMIESDEQLATRLQAEEQEQFSIEEKSKMLVEMIAERKKFFAVQRAAEQRSKPPTKAQIRNRMCTYLKNMGGYKHNQLKGRKVVKGSETRTEEISKRTEDELESDKSKKQKIYENVEVEVDDEAEKKKHMELVPNDEVAIDATPLATKPPVIVEWKIIKEGMMGHYQLIRANGSSKRYSSMIQMLQNIDKEDL